MRDRVHVGERGVDRIGAADVSDADLDARVERRGDGVHRRQESVEHPHRVALVEQELHQVGADEAAPTSDEDTHRSQLRVRRATRLTWLLRVK